MNYQNSRGVLHSARLDRPARVRHGRRRHRARPGAGAEAAGAARGAMGAWPALRAAALAGVGGARARAVFAIVLAVAPDQLHMQTLREASIGS